MLIFTLYDYLFGDFDIPFVSIQGFAALTVSLLYAFFMTVLVSFFWKLKVNKNMVFMDYFFLDSTFIVVKLLIVNSSIPFDQGNDVFDILVIISIVYLFVFRFPAWSK